MATTITEDYVSFETAKLLKKKGFDEKCRYVWVLNKANNPEDNNGVYKVSSPCFMEGESYVSNEDIDRVLKYSNEYYNKDAFLCPTLSVAIKWLRKVHNIFISIVFCTYPTEKRVTWIPEINTFDSAFPESAIEYDSYEEACEAAIKYCLEYLI